MLYTMKMFDNIPHLRGVVIAFTPEESGLFRAYDHSGPIDTMDIQEAISDTLNFWTNQDGGMPDFFTVCDIFKLLELDVKAPTYVDWFNYAWYEFSDPFDYAYFVNDGGCVTIVLYGCRDLNGGEV